MFSTESNGVDARRQQLLSEALRLRQQYMLYRVVFLLRIGDIKTAQSILRDIHVQIKESPLPASYGTLTLTLPTFFYDLVNMLFLFVYWNC